MAKSEEAKKIQEKQGLKEEFIEFINRGSMIDLAVGVAVGGAFTAIVNSFYWARYPCTKFLWYWRRSRDCLR